ncbi:molybdenum cofactor guanylyltransferase MobA [Staphylothermus hellenicus]|uniref:Molybdopterin-guanine dinucleotide biosynthesis protein A-like protein n=1 Tax=Staphylothermus hellenicus (strain DSM 12710 / JCM 10830 / BK20S6-10-b1 / P8) TaxID=591019 RepID=D7DCE7_STAHD|nr:molybdenum cofactor guanylyltransferase MobA [Staphylothermus hellenicus]ADI31844.1 Molybdopterin-guanine dinucleotide biosynthesis protein A-like protein [Staphylothermus hellenicus DSM 12710]
MAEAIDDMGKLKIAVLAGGLSTRFGSNKLFYTINGKPLILYVYERLISIFDEENIFFIASPHNAVLLRKIGLSNVLIDDILKGPISGIYIALKNLGDVFVFGGDMPCLNRELLIEMLNIWIENKFLALVPGWRKGFLEPLHAIYSGELLSVFEKSISCGELSITRLINKLDNKKILYLDDYPLEQKLSVYNVNTRDDIRCVEEGLIKKLPEPCLECLIYRERS